MLDNRPVFADVDPAMLTLDPVSARRHISRHTKALLAVDIYGNPADMRTLRRVADEHGLWYVADAAQSFGARRDGLPASSLADALVVSFTTGKALCAGEGGAILTNHPDLYQKLVWYTQHPSRQRRDLGLGLDNEFALNGRIHPWAAAWLLAHWDEALERVRARQSWGLQMVEALNLTALVEPLEFHRQGVESSFYRLTAAWRADSDEARLLGELRPVDQQLKISPPPVRLIYRQPAFLAQYGRRLRRPPHCPVAELQAGRRFYLERKVRTQTFSSVEEERHARPLVPHS